MSFYCTSLNNGDGVGHLQPKPEVIRRLVDHAFQILLAREIVVSGIDADSFENLGIFRQALPVEARHGELSPVFVAGAVVEHPEPARIFPRGRADVNALDCEGGSLLRQFIPVKGHRLHPFSPARP